MYLPKYSIKDSKVREAVKFIKSEVINPYQDDIKSTDLIDIASGQKASKEAQHDLTSIEKIGLDAINKSLGKTRRRLK